MSTNFLLLILRTTLMTGICLRLVASHINQKNTAHNTSLTIPSCSDLFGITNDNTCRDSSYTPGLCCKSKHMRYCLPYSIIIGSPKAGTTEIQNLLNHHPHIHASKREAHFFESDKYFAAGCKALNYISDPALLSNTALKPNTIIIDKSGNYLSDESAILRIHRMLPDIKLIFSMRHPTDRAFSHFAFFCKGKQFRRIVNITTDEYSSYMGNIYFKFTPDFAFAKYEVETRCDGQSFHDFIDSNNDISLRVFAKSPRDVNNSKAHVYDANRYISTYALGQVLSFGYYGTFLTNILEHFNKDNLLLMFLEEWRQDLNGTFKTLTNFLDIPYFPHIHMPEQISNAMNYSGSIWSEDKNLLDKFFTPHILGLQKLLLKTFNLNVPKSWLDRLRYD